MSGLIIPLPVRSDFPSYEFSVELEGAFYVFRFRWNARMGRWLMDVAQSDGTNLLAGIPVLVNMDLIVRFRSPLLPPGKLLAYDQSGGGENPGRENFGGEAGSVALFYFTGEDA